MADRISSIRVRQLTWSAAAQHVLPGRTPMNSFVICAKSIPAATLQRLGLPAAITIAGVIEGKEHAIWLPNA